MRYNRLLPIIIPLFILCNSEVFFYFPKMIYVIAVLNTLIYFFVIRQFIRASKRKESWVNFLILPVLFLIGSMFFSSMVSNKWLVQLLFVINAGFAYLYFRTVYCFLIDVKKYHADRLENISSYGNFLGFYFIASAIYGLQTFLNINTWILMIVLLLAILIIIYQVFWANRIDVNARLFYMLIISLVLVEMAWAASFMTLSFYILGLVLAVCYYMIIGLTRFYLLNTLTRSIIKSYLIFGFSSILLVLLTSNWISYN